MFADNDRYQLFKVPACNTCNNKSSKDDEYLLAILLSRADVKSNPSTNTLRAKLIRALNHPQKIGFAKAFHNSVSLINLKTPAGIYLGKHPVINIDTTRYYNIISKIIRGLYFRHLKKTLPDKFSIVVYETEELDKGPIEIKLFIQNEIISKIEHSPLYEIGKNTFRYKFALTENKEGPGAWLLNFYKSVFLLCLVLNTSDLNN